MVCAEPRESYHVRRLDSRRLTDICTQLGRLSKNLLSGFIRRTRFFDLICRHYFGHRQRLPKL